MTENTNNPPGVPQWVAGGEPGTPAEQQWQAEQQWLAARQGNAVPGAPGAPGAPAAEAKRKASDGKPSGLVLAGAGSLLAVLAFLGGTAVGHAWGSGGATQQTQFPGGGRFPQGQVPGGQVPGQQAPGTVPSTAPTTGTDPNQVPQQTQPSTGTQSPGVPGQGYGRRVPGQGPRGGQQSPGQQVPGQPAPGQSTTSAAKPA